MNDTPKPKRHWLRFSLRSLMLFMLLASIGMGWVAARMRAAKRQREAVAAIKALGGHVCYEHQLDSFGNAIVNAEPPGPMWLRDLLGNDFFTNVTSVTLNGSVTDIALRNLGQLPHIRELYLGQPWNSEITDAGMADIKGLVQLRRLELSGTNITDDGMAYFKGMSQLQGLSLEGTKIGDTGLAHIKGFTQIKWLTLDGTMVTDGGLAHIKGMNLLEALSLSNTQVGDTGLEHLAGMTQLNYLDLSKTRVTNAGIAMLQMAFPNCEIKYDDVMPLPSPSP